MATKTLFHSTNSKYKDSIENNGLKLNNGKIYLSDTPRHAFGNTCFKITIDSELVNKTINNWEYICKNDILPEHIEFYSFEEDDWSKN